MSEVMKKLDGPYEMFELADGGSETLRPVNWAEGTIVIHPKYEGAPAEKEIPALRVYVAPGTKKFVPLYWDITSKTLIAQLLPLLREAGSGRFEYVVTKYGVAPKARFTLERRLI